MVLREWGDVTVRFPQRNERNDIMECTRRTLVEGAGLAAAAMGMMGTVALADEAANDLGIADVLAERTTLHGNYNPDQPVTEEELALILNAAFSAPTGGNQRAIDFFVVNDPELMANLRAAHRNFGALETAPLVIVIAGNHNREKFPELLELDAGAAAMAICTEAAALGLSSCCMSITPQYDRVSGIANALGMPTDQNSPTFDPLIMVAIGHPGTDVVASASVTNYDETQVHINGYNGYESENQE